MVWPLAVLQSNRRGARHPSSLSKLGLSRHTDLASFQIYTGLSWCMFLYLYLMLCKLPLFTQQFQAKPCRNSRRVASIIACIDVRRGCNLMRVLIKLTAPKLLLITHQTLPKMMIYARVELSVHQRIGHDLKTHRMYRPRVQPQYSHLGDTPHARIAMPDPQ